MKWSKYQEDIFSAVEGSSSNLIIDAVAGSGKSTTLVEIAKRANTPGISLAFNKRIAEELNTKLDSSSLVSAMTLNALGHRAWTAAIGRPRLTLDTNKLISLAKDIEGIAADEFMEVVNLAKFARSSGLVPKGSKGLFHSLLDDTDMTWEMISLHYDVDTFNFDAARALLRLSIERSYDGYIDFDDQIYMSTLFGGRFNEYQLILVDETQDLSPLQHQMLKRLSRPTSRLIAVGDPFQSIYGFRGAMDGSMGELQQAFSMTPLPLSVCYRCGKNIVREAQRIVPHIESFDGSPEGSVQRLPSWSISDFPPGSAVICRNNAPLFAIAMALLADHRPVNFVGRDIVGGLSKIIDKITKKVNMGIQQFLVSLEHWATNEIALKPRREGIVLDKQESLIALADGVRDTEELKSVLSKLQSSSPSAIHVSSIHRAKGLEWSTVYFLDEWRIPSKYAIQDWQVTQENNCRYIAVTRAKSSLNYINA